MLREDDFVALRPEWVLRNEGSQVILYLLSQSEAHFQILTPKQAVVLPFLDGQHTVTALGEAIGYIFNLPSSEDAHTFLENTVEEINANKEKIAILNEPSPWKCNYDPLDFIIPRDKYVPNRRLTRPMRLLIYFSGWCQTNCVYCYADLHNMRRLKHLPLDQWLRIMREARDLDIRLVDLTGGDPLGRPDSIAFFEELIEMGFLFLLSTKCYISLTDAQRLTEAGFNEPVQNVRRELQISIDSPDSTVANYLTGRKGYLERATRSVQNVIAAGFDPIVKAVITPLNFHQVRDHVDFFAALGVRHFRFSTYGRSYYRHDDRLFTSDEVRFRAAELLDAAAREHPDLRIEKDVKNVEKMMSMPHNGLDFREKRWAERTGCSAGRTSLGVAPDGHAVLCEQMPLTQAYFVGDLTKQSILEVWNSPELLDFIYPPRERFAETPCEDCPEFDNCIYEMGHCFRESFFAFGRLYTAPPNCPRTPLSSYRSM
jgi:radical SAM protein with 4Fe4S-binding SPASM domain